MDPPVFRSRALPRDRSPDPRAPAVAEQTAHDVQVVEEDLALA